MDWELGCDATTTAGLALLIQAHPALRRFTAVDAP